jgi:hypothetical protein
LLCGQAPPPLLDLPTQPTTLRNEEATVTPQGIRLHIKDRSLQEVLRYIQDSSGIRFFLPHTLLTVPVTADIAAPDWPTAVRQLLLPFQTAEVWEDGHTQLRQIFILGSQPAAPAPAVTPPSPPENTAPPEGAATTERQEAQ